MEISKIIVSSESLPVTKWQQLKNNSNNNNLYATFKELLIC